MCDVTLLTNERNTCTNASWFLETVASTATRGCSATSWARKGPWAFAYTCLGGVSALKKACRRHAEEAKWCRHDTRASQRPWMRERIQGEECVDGMQNGDATALLDHGGLLS